MSFTIIYIGIYHGKEDNHSILQDTFILIHASIYGAKQTQCEEHEEGLDSTQCRLMVDRVECRVTVESRL